MTEIDPHHRPSLAPRVRLQIDTVRQEPVLLYPEGLLVLSPTAHEIVRRCDGHTSIESIVRSLGDEFDATEEILRQDVLETLADLQQRNFIVLDP